MELSCEDGKLIHLVRTNYGRFSLTICNEFGYSNYSIQCNSFRSFLVMQTECNNRTTCSVPVSEDLFGDPCPNTTKVSVVVVVLLTLGPSRPCESA